MAGQKWCGDADLFNQKIYLKLHNLRGVEPQAEK